VVFFFVAEFGVFVEDLVVDFNGFKVVFDNFAAPIFAVVLISEVGF
jgi:hypothetical protein